jgi:hypothetical protein
MLELMGEQIELPKLKKDKEKDDLLGAQARADVYTRIQMVMASWLRLEKGTSVLGVLRGGAENWRMEQV